MGTPQNLGWHVDRTVNVTHMLTTISAIVVVGIFLARQDTRIALVEQQQVQQAINDKKQDERSLETKVELNKRLDEIRDDVKKILERTQRR